MTVEEFEEKRALRWRLRSEYALTTEREVFKFVQDVGAASLSPGKELLFPSLIHAIDGSSHRRHRQWYKNGPFSELIEKFWNRYSESRRIFQVALPKNTPGVASREWIIALFAILSGSQSGRRRGGNPVKPSFSRFELAIYEIIQENGPIPKNGLALALNLWKKTSRRKLEKGLFKLWSALKILRLGYTRRGGALWDTPTRWDPSLAESSAGVLREGAAADLIKKYVEMTVATSRKRISKAFAGILTPSEVSETLHYLLLKRSIVVDKELVLDGKRALTAGPHR
jgi:hypothetical protein